VAPRHPVHFGGTFSPASTPDVQGLLALSSSFHQRGQGISIAVTDGRTSSSLTAQTLDMGQYSSSPYVVPTLLDSNDIAPGVLYGSHSVQSRSFYLDSNLNHLPASPLPGPSPENLSDHLAPESTFAQGAGRGIRGVVSGDSFSNEASPVPPALPQSESINSAAEIKKQSRCPICGVNFTQPQVRNRHMKDKHEEKESCAHCPSFKWSRGRPHLYRKHLRVKHSGLDLPDSPGSTGRDLQELDFTGSPTQKSRIQDSSHFQRFASLICLPF